MTNLLNYKIAFRQNAEKDKEFIQILDRIGTGKITLDDYKVLATRREQVLNGTEK